MPTYNKSADTAMSLAIVAASVKSMRRVASNSMSLAVDSSEVLAPQFNKSASNSATFSINSPGYYKEAANSMSLAIVASSIKTKQGISALSLNITMDASASITKSFDAESSIVVGVAASRAPSILHKFCTTELQVYGGANIDLEQGKVGFFFPYGGPTTQVIFKKPLFGDNREQFDQVEVRHSRAGERYSYAKTPTYTKLNFTFTEVSQSLAESFLTFCKTSKAQDVKLIDWYQRTWRGVIVNEPRVIQSIARGVCNEVFTLTVQFEGELV